MLASLFFSVAIGTVPVRASEIPLYASPDLGLSSPVPSKDDLAKPFVDPLPIITRNASDTHAGQIASCQDWLDLKDPIVDSDNGPDYNVVMIQSVICGGLDLLRKARPAKETALPVDFLKYRDLRKYPATIWVSISNEDVAKASKPGSSLRDLTGKTTFQVVNQKELSLTSGARQLTLTLLARGDFDGSGWESAAFDWEGRSVGGSYDVNRLVILTRRTTDEPFREIRLDSHQ